MKHRWVVGLIVFTLAAAAVAREFTYQGFLEDNGSPAEGVYDFRLSVFADKAGNMPLVLPLELQHVSVRNGEFSLPVSIDGLPAWVDQGWLQVAVRAPADSSYLVLDQAVPFAAKSQLCPESWALAGNASTHSGVNFLGTTDHQALVLRTANARSLRVEPSDQTFGEPALPITVNWIAGSHANTVAEGVRGATIGGGGVPVGDSDPDFTNEGPNQVTDHFGTVAGGYGNRAGDDAGSTLDARYASVGGGFINTAAGLGVVVGGGTLNVASGSVSTIAGGDGNAATGTASSIGGGSINQASGDDSTVAGGLLNVAEAPFGSIGGGWNNLASGQSSALGGGAFNIASGPSSTIGGGVANTASGSWSTISGGSGNQATNGNSTVGGGWNNVASGADSTLAGGYANTASAFYSSVGGGTRNTASGYASVVSGGQFNIASGNQSNVLGGVSNSASGQESTASGGIGNCAGGDQSWVGGSNANVRPGPDAPPSESGCIGVNVSPDNGGDRGTFVWADSQQFEAFTSTGPDQFLVRAQGGIWFGSTSSPDIPKDRFINTSTGAHLTAGGAWTNASSRALKTGFAGVDRAKTLQRVLELPILSWRYRGSDAEGLHMGPIAEDFHAAFELGADAQSISTVDANGVALAAIQGLNEKLESRNLQLAQEIEALRQELRILRSLLVPEVAQDGH